MKQSIKPELGREYTEPEEARDTEVIISAIKKRLEREYKPGETLRQFHAKMHGCVKATFTVLPDIPANFQHGFLIPEKKYDAWIRYSNGNTKVTDDRKGDLRGMAIKLLDVPGEILINDHQLPQSHDFLLVSYPTLMSGTVSEFKKNIIALCHGSIGLLAFGLNPANWPTIYRTIQSMKKCESVLSLSYYSVSPYRLGTAEQAVKYAAVPTSIDFKLIGKKHKNFLREQMQKELAERPITFDLMIQMQENALTMPIENPCVKWSSHWHKVASIEIPPQRFDTPEQSKFGEDLTFSPWHSLKENQPLGGINRVRKATYEAISKFRLERNGKNV